jgi:N-acylneuraminate cytidylyltransferase
MRVDELRELGIEMMILSSEVSSVVSARAKKMGVEAVHGVGLSKKGEALRQLLAEKDLNPSHVVYLGNDLNDLPCFAIAGWAVAVADAYPEVIRAADFVLSRPGGRGAVRELCDLILGSIQEKK